MGVQILVTVPDYQDHLLLKNCYKDSKKKNSQWTSVHVDLSSQTKISATEGMDNADAFFTWPFPLPPLSQTTELQLTHKHEYLYIGTESVLSNATTTIQ
jgi:hypothetical protein